MINTDTNPWVNMDCNAARRIDMEIIHNLFWVQDQMGNYGFYIKTAEIFINTEINIRLKGISFIKRNENGFGELFLILNRHSDWELFYTICNDLISVCALHQSNEKMVIAVENRLKRWQIFLMQNTDVTLPLILQMGLFAELTYFKDFLVPRIGIGPSLMAWVGPDSDKQDFALSELATEVKSYKTSKGPCVTISSSHQLFSDNKPLYLIAFGLTESDQGTSVVDLINEINDLLVPESVDLFQTFEKKLIAYGFMPGMIYNHMFNFIVDNIRGFAVVDDFPRIIPNQIAPEIISLNYTIDLQLCTRFEKPLANII
ncbi:PD-(D/E)XK motif protein [Flavobacterium sp. GSN2]|nr:PD-(D/E)XK motif protein [Flavobacterium sp. GSN2]